MMASTARSRNHFSETYVKHIVETMLTCLTNVIITRVIIPGSFPGGLLGEIRGLIASENMAARYDFKPRIRFLLSVVTRLETNGRIGVSADIMRLKLLEDLLEKILKDHTSA